MKKEAPVYSFQGRVRYSETDETGTLTLGAMLDYLQDCALFQCESLGVGIDHVRETGLSWLLAAWQIQVVRRPRFNEQITVSTWATSFKGLIARRNFLISSSQGEELVRADSMWFMYQASEDRAIRPPQNEVEVYAADLRAAPLPLPPMRRRIPVEGEGVPGEPIVVTRAYIDTNHHVNNEQYVQMALEAVPSQVGDEVRWLEVQYISAAHLGDVVVPVVRHQEPPEEEGSVRGVPASVAQVRAPDIDEELDEKGEEGLRDTAPAEEALDTVTSDYRLASPERPSGPATVVSLESPEGSVYAVVRFR